MADPHSEATVAAWVVPGGGRRWAQLLAGPACTRPRLYASTRPPHVCGSTTTRCPSTWAGSRSASDELGAPDPLVPVREAPDWWRYIARSVENHPLSLPAGDYEVLFSARRGWSDPPREIRALAFALTGMSFHESYEIEPGGLDMASPRVEEQLVSGWFDAEQSDIGTYRWAAGHAAAVVRLPEGASGALLSYRLPPVPSGGLKIELCPLDEQVPAWSTHLAWRDGDWHEERFTLQLPAGDYLALLRRRGNLD